jgi:hypothetical protein
MRGKFGARFRPKIRCKWLESMSSIGTESSENALQGPINRNNMVNDIALLPRVSILAIS